MPRAFRCGAARAAWRAPGCPLPQGTKAVLGELRVALEPDEARLPLLNDFGGGFLCALGTQSVERAAICFGSEARGPDDLGATFARV